MSCYTHDGYPCYFTYTCSNVNIDRECGEEPCSGGITQNKTGASEKQFEFLRTISDRLQNAITS